jgi:hypothetical protein
LLWELLGFIQNSILIPLLQPNNFLLLVNRRVHEHLKFFNEHSKLSGCCHSGLEFPTKIQAQEQDHKEGGVCKKLNTAPFLHVPLPSPSIPAALHEIYHEVGKLLL